MFFIPGFDPKTMTDAELISKSNDLIKRLNWTSRYSVGGQGVDQLRAMIAAIDFECKERQFMENWELMQQYIGENIETDIDFKARAKTEKEKTNPTPAAKSRPRMTARRVIPTPTLYPVVPSKFDPTSRIEPDEIDTAPKTIDKGNTDAS